MKRSDAIAIIEREQSKGHFEPELDTAISVALRMAAAAKEDHDRMIHLRGVLSQLAWRAAEANRASEEDRPRKMQAVLGELLSAARMQGLIRDEGGDFK